MRPRAGLFVTCLVDLMRPSIGFAAARLIEASGCEVIVPVRQTCCGQPAYNSGRTDTARILALQTIDAFEGCDYVVAPSGSCAAMLKIHYPALLKTSDAITREKVSQFAGRVQELCAFLADVRGMTAPPGTYQGRVTYHDACSGLRELGIREAPRRLLAAMPGVDLHEMADADACCGFGGLFSTKYPDISDAIVTRKSAAAESADAHLLLAGDLGCLMNIAGKLSRQGRGPACRHIAEVLAGEMADPAIGRATDDPKHEIHNLDATTRRDRARSR